MTDVIVTLKQTDDAYGDCGERLLDLQTWLLEQSTVKETADAR